LILHHGDLVISPLEISRTIPSLLPNTAPGKADIQSSETT
jgi:hypothetical protein